VNQCIKAAILLARHSKDDHSAKLILYGGSLNALFGGRFSLDEASHMPGILADVNDSFGQNWLEIDDRQSLRLCRTLRDDIGAEAPRTLKKF